ncbi:MAG: hypothetical protein CL841_08625 [Crocinitomicaceae bacterium]|nr:hypothetical protein [Crocinitomicaceae bacterium]
MNQKLSEYHSGFRAFTSEVLKDIKFNENSDDFIFDNQMLAQIMFKNYLIGEITCPTKYFKEASSINFQRSLVYGIGVIWTSIKYFLTKIGIINWKILI